MRLTRAMGDVTIGTLIVMVHSAIAERLPRPRVEAGEPQDRPRGAASGVMAPTRSRSSGFRPSAVSGGAPISAPSRR